MMENVIKDSLEFHNFNDMFELLTKEEMRSVGWRLNYSPRDDYEFPEYAKDKTNDEEKLIFNKEFSESDFEVKGLVDTLLNRESTLLNELKGSWNLEDLEKLLVLSAGRRWKDRDYPRADKNVKVYLRTYPSGGSLYPIKIYFYANKIEGLEAGFYYFDPVDNSIRRLKSAISLSELEQLFPMTSLKLDVRSETMEKSAAVVFMVADFKYSFRKYGQLSYRLALLEAGHIGQNMQLVVTALGKDSLPICGLFHERIEQALGIRKNKFQHCVYGVVLG
ncbi:SagB/ThcOx family dehydrogenase [Clostridium manihotivorum]|uniref:Dehydrogenase n=1 Tax=Clostridium manihotivorum TaxID=2320868 RepID=A0A3R5QS67_9CLOT|nr:SagB/ThcOx family dehydrogenase [Clostridium manihotivorum]QAA31120.1 dehydrogenase [Clostridium manihotivorum]